MSRKAVGIGLFALLSTASASAVAGFNEVGINVDYLSDTDNTPAALGPDAYLSVRECHHLDEFRRE